MALLLKGSSWYLRKQVGGVRRDVALGVYGGEANRKKAEKAAVTMERRLAEAHATAKVLEKFGVTPPEAEDDGPTFKSWWDDYAKVYEPRKAARTQARDTQIIAKWMPMLGHKLMAEIKPKDCMAGLDVRRKAFAGREDRKVKNVVTEATVQRERRLLQAVFERAVENDIIEKNPWRGIERVADTSRSDRVLTPADEAKLLDALTEARSDAVGKLVAMNGRYARFVTFMLQTGLRLDEVLNADFTDLGDRVRVTGKFGKVREVPLTKVARQTLDDQIKADGRVWWQTPQRFREVLETACARAAIGHFSPHDLRHTFGQRFLARGGDIYVLSKLLGHASVSVTEKHYAFMRREDVASKMLAVMEG